MRISGVRLLQTGRRHRRTILRARRLAGERAKTSGKPFADELTQVIREEIERAWAAAKQAA